MRPMIKLNKSSKSMNNVSNNMNKNMDKNMGTKKVK